MKNILIAFGIVVTVALLFVAVLKAETPERITIINSGKAGGSFNARTQMYKEGLIAAGYDVRYENVGKISQAVKMFKASDEPTIMVYANNQVYKQDLFHTDNNFIMLEYQQPLYVCRTNASKGKVTTLTVAHGKGSCTPSEVLPMMVATVIGKHVDLWEIRKVIFDITMDIQFVEYHTSRKLTRPTGTWENELVIVQTLEKGYAVK